MSVIGPDYSTSELFGMRCTISLGTTKVMNNVFTTDSNLQNT
jgi:hypothetical protein